MLPPAVGTDRAGLPGGWASAHDMLPLDTSGCRESGRTIGSVAGSPSVIEPTAGAQRGLRAAMKQLSTWYSRLGDPYKAGAAVVFSGVLVSAPIAMGYSINSASAALALIGAIVLAIPALRVNVQARLVHELAESLAALERKEMEARKISDDYISRQILDTLSVDREHVLDAHARSSREKGSWRPWLEVLLYSGYAAVLAAAVLRFIVTQR